MVAENEALAGKVEQLEVQVLEITQGKEVDSVQCWKK